MQGFVYVLDSLGKTKPGWPLQMGEIQAQAGPCLPTVLRAAHLCAPGQYLGPVQVTVADVDGDGQLEIVAGDTLGTLAVFTAQGQEVWERHVKSGLSQARPGCRVQRPA